MKIVLLFLFTYLSVTGFAQTYTPVDDGSKVHFVIKNFAIGTGGDFKGLKGSIQFDPKKITESVFNVSVEAATVDTDSEMRDDHIKEEEYFDVAKFPTINLKSTRITNANKAGYFYIFANLTIKGVTKLVQFPFTATAKDGGYVFEGNFDINRLDFKVGGKSMSMQDNVKVSLKVFAKK